MILYTANLWYLIQPFIEWNSGGKFMDPWDKEYQYRLNGRFSYELKSSGPDGVMDNADDIAVTDV